jgi:hypothetical protein
MIASYIAAMCVDETTKDGGAFIRLLDPTGAQSEDERG